MEQLKHLTGELKSLIGPGARRERLPLLPVLRSLSSVDEDADIEDIGEGMYTFLIASINSLPDCEFEGTTHSAQKLNRVYKVLLKIERSREYAAHRRTAAIMLLGLRLSESYWRSDSRYERAFMRLLAQHIIRSASGQIDDQQAAA
jgi:hypothetical protein